MKFTYDLDIHEGWRKTSQIPSDFEDVKHLGKCAIDGDMFAAYNNEGEIHIFKGTMEEETLKTNTWYKGNTHDQLVYRTGDVNNYWIYDKLDYDNAVCTTPNVWTEATDEEIQEALTKVAKEKGFQNINELTLKDFDGEIFHKGTFECSGNHYIYNNGKLFLDGVTIFKDGKWVEIVELTLEQRIKNLEDKIF